MVDGSSQAYRSRTRAPEQVGLFVATNPGPAVVGPSRPQPLNGPIRRHWSEPGQEPSLTGVPAFTAPALVLLASLCILQGYTWLDFIPDSRRHSSALWFAGIVLVSVVFLSRPERGRRRMPAQWLTLVTAVAVALVTLPAVYGHLRAVGDAMGVLDLLLAASALGAAVVGSRVGRASR
jgi:hypothetical protein